MISSSERRTPCLRATHRQANAGRVFGHQDGFTIIELIIVIVILGILGVYTFSFLGNSMGAYVWVKGHKILYDEGRLAMERMVREIRDASRATVSVSGSSITFTKLHTPAGSVNYNLTGTTLNRVAGGTPYAMAGNVQSFTPAINADSVVTLDLVLTVPGGGTVGFRTSINPRAS